MPLFGPDPFSLTQEDLQKMLDTDLVSKAAEEDSEDREETPEGLPVTKARQDPPASAARRDPLSSGSRHAKSSMTQAPSTSGADKCERCWKAREECLGAPGKACVRCLNCHQACSFVEKGKCLLMFATTR
jgi:hypothetical protein